MDLVKWKSFGESRFVSKSLDENVIPAMLCGIHKTGVLEPVPDQPGLKDGQKLDL